MTGVQDGGMEHKSDAVSFKAERPFERYAKTLIWMWPWEIGREILQGVRGRTKLEMNN